MLRDGRARSSRRHLSPLETLPAFHRRPPPIRKQLPTGMRGLVMASAVVRYKAEAGIVPVQLASVPREEA